MSEKTAVVIDDEVDLTEYISTILEEGGFKVYSANDAKSGEDLVRKHTPQVILIDLMMPGRSGVQLFVRLRGNEVSKETPLVMVTGIKTQMGVDWGEVVERFKVRQPDGFVEKPINPELLLSVVNGVISREQSGGEVLRS